MLRLVGMTKDELQDLYKFYLKDNTTTNIREVWMLPDDIILNTRRAFSTNLSAQVPPVPKCDLSLRYENGWRLAYHRGSS